MSILGIDLGGTKLATDVFSEQGSILREETIPLEKRSGTEVGGLVVNQIRKLMAEQEGKGDSVQSIGISVPGISNRKSGLVWAPNIPGWEKYPLREEVREVNQKSRRKR